MFSPFGFGSKTSVWTATGPELKWKDVPLVTLYLEQMNRTTDVTYHLFVGFVDKSININ